MDNRHRARGVAAPGRPAATNEDSARLAPERPDLPRSALPRDHAAEGA